MGQKRRKNTELWSVVPQRRHHTNRTQLRGAILTTHTSNTSSTRSTEEKKSSLLWRFTYFFSTFVCEFMRLVNIHKTFYALDRTGIGIKRCSRCVYVCVSVFVLVNAVLAVCDVVFFIWFQLRHSIIWVLSRLLRCNHPPTHTQTPHSFNCLFWCMFFCIFFYAAT